MNENFIYEYHVEWYDPVDQVNKKSFGLTWADSYANAMNKIAEYFHDNYIISACIAAWDTEVLEFDCDTLMYLRKENVV